MLLPEYVGIQDPAAPLRARCVEAIRVALEGRAATTDAVVVVTGHDPSSRTSRPPLGVRIGELVLEQAGWTGPVERVVVPFDATPASVADAGRALAGRAERLLLLVVGDGSARRDEQAPGHLDARAVALDRATVTALGAADPAALIEIDPGLAGELLATGRAALQVLAHAVRGSALECEQLWSDDPYGVLYAVAVWVPDAGSPAPREGAHRHTP
jgi:hypothetical protein